MPRVKKDTVPEPVKLTHVWFCNPIYWDEDWRDDIINDTKYTMYINDGVLVLNNNNNQEKTFVPISNIKSWNL
jgi:hypothetical protein